MTHCKQLRTEEVQSSDEREIGSVEVREEIYIETSHETIRLTVDRDYLILDSESDMGA